MASFAALGYTLAAGTVFSSLTLSIFGIAVRNQQEGVAPRCAARPKETIYCANPTHEDQDRGNPFYGWIKWTLKWSYETLLTGIPGTGTRKNGLEGRMLQMNLDAVIFLRFNALCLRIAALTAVLVIVIILPVNWTGNPNNTSNTFDRTTLANIPPLQNNNHNMTTEDLLTPGILLQKLSFNLQAEMSTQLRLYAIVLCSWIVTYFLCIEIKKEWKDNLKLRRKYYFEANHYKTEKDKRDKKPLDKVDYINKRYPWVPNPEECDTVTNIELYSLIIGDVPDLCQESNEKGYTEQEEIDWQTAYVKTFFDKCIPNQPGFSSSVAAITILPSASNLTKAWKEWNKAASALRKLRCIRSVISERKPTSLIEKMAQNKTCRRDMMMKTKELKNDASLNIFRSYFNTKDVSVDQKMLMLAECDDDVEGQLMDALHYGPQQKAYYGREFAQASTSFFGNYFLSRKYNNATNEQLVEFETEALSKVEETNQNLKKAQMSFVLQNRGNKPFECPVMKRLNLVTESEKKTIEDLLSLPVDKAEMDCVEDPNTLDCRMSGNWPDSVSGQGLLQCFCSNLKKIIYSRPKKLIGIYKKSTYAVVTFTNRQAAVAARQCLADGRGGTHWHAVKAIPVPPLADAPPFSLNTRDFLRPVTVTISSQFKVVRNWTKNVLLIMINLFYTLPLTAIASVSNTTDLVALFPNSEWIKDHNTSLDGLIYALLYALFVSICPYIFEVIACWGSNASSLSRAELSAMKYYWLFILVTSFTGVNIANSIVAALKAEQEDSWLYDIVKSVADTIPVSVSFNWLNIIMKSTTLTMPFFYLLQAQYSIFSLVGCKKFGSHPSYLAGVPLPYRAYIDCGTVFLCAVTLSFASPLVAPFATLFFLVSEPIMRRCFIYVYIPEFDGGGFRWPFLSEMCYSSMIMGQMLLFFMISFKKAIFPAFLSFITVIPTILFRKLTYARYYQAYVDTSLLQTSSLDMRNPYEHTSLKERQEFRDFLVDAHKAAYIPVCIAGSTTSMLTTEPAVAVAIPTDQDANDKNDITYSTNTDTMQRGASLRRVNRDLGHRNSYASELEMFEDESLESAP